MPLPKTHPLYGAVEALAIPLFVERTGLLPSEWYRDNLDGYQDGRKQCLKSACETIRALEAAGYRVVGPEPTEAQWGGLARAIVMWCQMTAPHTPNTLLKHLERTGETVPDWLLAEPEMANRDHAMSKGTIAVIIWRAMRETAPTITGTEKSDE